MVAMDPKHIAQCKQEYYESLAENPSLHDLLNQDGGLLLARVGSHPPWPSRFSEPGEYAKMVRHRQKKGQLCVYFFGTRNYGWVYRNAIMPFSDDYTAIKASRKFSTTMVQRAIEALDEAKLILDDTTRSNIRFYDRIMETRDDDVDMPCEVCNRVDDHISLLILCDGKDCQREFHMNCLNPPLQRAPPGDWYCPECAKDPSKQVKVETSTPKSSGESSTTPNGAKVGASDSSKKVKVKEGSLKRKLPSTPTEKGKSSTGADGSKKSRQQRVGSEASLGSSPQTHTSRPGTPVLGQTAIGNRKASSGPTIEIPGSGHQSGDEMENGNGDSEERCLICGYGGELVVCEFYGCTKVYHQYCLGAFPFPDDEDATWYCPRHTCAISGATEVVDDAEMSLPSKSPRKPSLKMAHWKCSQCPAALSDEAMPSIPKSQVVSKVSKTFVCGHCGPNAPVKVQLAKNLEKIWSMMATNRQGLPFCGPLLPGVTTAHDESSHLDLFRILAKIRRLEYDDSAAFASDVDKVVHDALEVVGDRSEPLSEAAKTLSIICTEQLETDRAKFDSLDSKIIGLKSLNKSSHLLEFAFIGSAGLERKKWPLRWRQECGPFEDKFYPSVEARSLPEWTAYVTAAPLYASCDELEKIGEIDSATFTLPPVPQGGQMGDMVETNEVGIGIATSERHDSRLPGFPGLSLTEGTDVIMALASLSSRSNALEQPRPGRWDDQELEENDGRDYFLSPSISEMQQMFDQQSALLRRALESHTALQRSWLLTQQQLLGVGPNRGMSVGEGRLAAELRVSNKNLRARLRNKDKLLNRLTSDHMKLRAEVQALEYELAETKARLHTPEKPSKNLKASLSTKREDENGDTEDDEGTSSTESTPSGRKSPRTTSRTKTMAKPGNNNSAKPAPPSGAQSKGARRGSDRAR